MIVVFVVVKTRMFTREELRNKIFQGNAIDVLKTFPSKSVEMCITSPPYWGLRDYQSEDIIWDSNNECEHDFSTKAPPRRNRSTDDFKFAGEVQKGNIGSSPNLPETSFCSKCSAGKGSLGLEPTHELYIKHLCDIFEETKGVLKDTGTLWVNLGDTYASSPKATQSFDFGRSGKNSAVGLQSNSRKGRGKAGNGVQNKSLVGVPFRFVIEMINRGWICRQTIIWYKNNVMPSSVKDRFTVDFEYIFFFSKQGKYYFEQQKEENGRNKRSVWNVNTKPHKEAHFAVFPEELIETPIKAGCPEFVCVTCGHSREEKFESLSTKDYSNESNYKRQIDLEHGQSAFNRNQATFDSVSYNSKGLSDCGCGDEFKRGMVLDIFAGSGTTAVVAKKNNRDYVGIELNGDYIDMCKERLESYNNHRLDLWTQGNRTQQNKASHA